MISENRRLKNQEKKEHTRNQLLIAAKRVFIEKGYHQTMIAHIVGEAGMGQGTFYRHFKDKRDIFEALLDNLISKLILEFQDYKMNPAKNFKEYQKLALTAILKMARIIDQEKELSMMFIREIPCIDKEFSNKLNLLLSLFKEMAKFHIDHGIKKGFTRKCNSEVVSWSIVGIGLSLLTQWQNKTFKKKSLESIINEAVDFGFLGLKK